MARSLFFGTGCGGGPIGSDAAGMDLRDRIERMITPTVEGLGFAIVRVQVTGKRTPHVQVMAEPREGGTMTVDDCAEISRAISAVLDVDDPIAGAYTLEVSSPGIDRPLTRLEDFRRFAGLEAQIEADRPVDGRRRFRGRLAGVAGDAVEIEVDGQPMRLPHADIRRAKLVLTDELLARAQQTQRS